jgi:putative transcriptional regulator
MLQAMPWALFYMMAALVGRVRAQEALTQRLDVSRQTVNAIEREKYDPSLPLAFKIAAVFGLTIEEIFEPD